MKYKRGYYDILVRAVTTYPSKVAVRVYDDGFYRTYTYSELYGVCEYISQNLQQLTKSANPGAVGLITERNVIVPAVIAAVHKSYTTFMFLDPIQNIEEIVTKMKFKMLMAISENGIHELLGRKPDKILQIFNQTISLFDVDGIGNVHSIVPFHEHSYIAQTSGSTGEPKHIQVPIQCLQPNIDDLTDLFAISKSDIIYFSTPLTFDPSMVEILLACMNGASLLIAPERVDSLFPLNTDNSITFWQTTPSKFLQFSNTDISQKIFSENSTLKILALGGEPLTGVQRLKELRADGNKTRVFVLYGVTEISCWACVTEVLFDNVLDDREIPLGTCLSETEVVVKPTKENKNLGRILLGSKQRKCAILSKWKTKEDENIVKWVDTGDLGEMRNGTIYYRGRCDDVVKRFGHKIYLNNIEAAAMMCPAVKTCSCLWLPKPMLLVLYYSSETYNTRELSNFLKCKLDDRHQPDKIIRVDTLPVNRHGKISKHVLSKTLRRNVETAPSELSIKLNLLNEVKQVLGKSFAYDDIKDKNFFSIGGTSFLAVTMSNTLSHKYPILGKSILPYLINQNNTIDDILQLVKEKYIEESESRRKVKIKRSRLDSDSYASTFSGATTSDPMIPIGFELLWSYDTGKCVDASPALFRCGFNTHVTVGSHSGRVVSAEARSGHVQGQLCLDARIEASVHCYQHPSSLMSPRGVVGAYDGSVVCFSLEDCSLLWKTNVGAMVKSKATLCNGNLYVASYDGFLRCLDPVTGTTKAAIQISAQAISADLVAAKNNYILIGTLAGECLSVEVASHSVAWRGKLGSPVFASPMLYDQDKYVMFAEVNGEIHCRTVEKGIKIWRYQGARGNIFSSMYVEEIANQRWRIIFGCHDSHVYCINVKNCQPSLHWKCQMPSPVYSTPRGLRDNLIIAVANNGYLAVIDEESGTIIAHHELPGETFSSPDVISDYIFIGCRNDKLYALKFND